jgi:hypothetical protein
MLATLACAFVACTQPLPTAPDDALLLAQASGDITITYECGNTFLFRNRSIDTLTLSWRVRGNHEAGTVFLPARSASAEFSETRVTTKVQGPLQVLRNGRELQTIPNGHGAGCPVVLDTFPTLPPESVSNAFMDSVFAPGNLLTDGHGPTRVPKNIVVIAFRAGSTVEDRAAAVRLVGGVVVGGVRLSPDRYYYVRVPATGNSASLGSYLDSLSAQPAVESATPLGVMGVQGLRPQDGFGWTSWSFHGAGAGQNWAFEALRFPMAWGCTTGSDAIRIGVVDSDFDPDPDLVTNTLPSYQTSYGAFTATGASAGHGTRVLSLIGAKGNNSAGMTGGMWSVSLQPAEIFDNGIAAFPRYEAAILELARAGTPVINVSAGLLWGYKPTGTSVERGVQLGAQNAVQNALRDAATTGMHPLVVVSAGNDGAFGVDARWNGTPAVYDAFPDQVLTVGAAARQGLLTGSPKRDVISNTGAYVHVYAPGREVYSLASANAAPTPESGTSFAAPLVTAIAGLLLSSDPTLTADSVRALILAAAANSGVTIEGAHLADAYGALRLLARNENAPLCGNRLTVEGHEIKAERNPGVFVPLVTVGGNRRLFRLLTFHGGRKFVIRHWSADSAYTMQPDGTWGHAQLWDRDSTDLTGSAVSQYGETHERDGVYHVSGGTLWKGKTYRDNTTVIAPVPTLSGHSDGGSQVCVREVLVDQVYQCQQMITTGFSESPSWRREVATLGDSAVLLIKDVYHYGTTYDAVWYDCYFPDQPATSTSFCRYRHFGTGGTLPWTSLWRMDLTAATPHADSIDVIAGRYLVGITSAEDGSGYAISSGVPHSTTGDYLVDCTTQFRSFSAAGAAVPYGPPHPYGADQTLDQCDYLYWGGGFGATQQQLTSNAAPPTEGFALQARAIRALDR